ncbi:hypothetical protein BH20ACT6_BH20ACT6_18950 [soil metagenome]
MRPTSAATLAATALLGALLGGLVPAAFELAGAIAPTVPWSAAVALAFLAALLLALAASTWRTLHRRRLRIEAGRAVALLVLGRAAALSGALVAGGYLAFGLTYIGRIDAALPRERLVHGLVAALAAAALAASGIMLERACRVPDSDRDE